MTTIKQAMQQVSEFHRKLRVLERAKFERLENTGENSCLHDHALTLHRIAKRLEERVHQPRSLRAHLMIEELAETVGALADGRDEIALLDGLTDLLYVLLGTAAIYDLPLEEAFLEVHRSNMTKEKQPDDAAANRVRKKGPNYSPPDLKRVLELHRGRVRCGACCTVLDSDRVKAGKSFCVQCQEEIERIEENV
jgi:predicted HAD superfamily Cof-like phosphohydrolase